MASTTSASHPEPAPTELIFLGTGTSGAIPVISCLTSPKRKTTPCPTCCSPNPKNKRMNTGAALRIPKPSTSSSSSSSSSGSRSSSTPLDDTNSYTLLIDCGKTFFPTAIDQFPRHNLRRIDALLLTHAHADAFFGLDDLRAWTLPSMSTDEPAIQDHIDVYCDAATMAQVEQTFPYLVDKRAATGGGDVPSFVWWVFDPIKGGVRRVGAGANGSDEPSNGIRSGTQDGSERAADESGSFRIASCGGLKVTPLPVEHGLYMKTGAPFMCMGFRVGEFSWVSDCSGVPAETRERMRGSRVVVMDGLKWEPHASHFGIQQGREWVRDNLGPGEGWRKRAQKKHVANGTVNGDGDDGKGDAGPERTWLVGFSHNVEHEDATKESEAWGKTEGRGMWVRPSWDGLRIGIDGAPIERST